MATRVTEESWFGRIGGAIKGILVGGLLTIVSVPVLFWNEGRAVRTAKGLKEGAKVVIDIQPDQIDAANDGKFVHTTGETTTDDVLRDEDFALQYNGVRLNRHVEMYQWQEDSHSKTKKKLGGGTQTVTTYSYDKDWFPRVIDSSEFEEASTHQNPTDCLFPEASYEAKNVMLGQFRLPSALIGMIRGKKSVELTDANIPERVSSAAAIRSDGPGGSSRIYIARDEVGTAAANRLAPAEPVANPNRPELIDLEPGAETQEADGVKSFDTAGEPQIGDVRVWFTATPVTTVSLLSQQKGETFRPFETHYGTSINVLREGTYSAAEMIAQEEAANRMLTWVLRGVGTLVMFFGFMLLLRPLVVLADVLPLAGSLIGFGTAIVAGLLTIAGSLTVIGIAWVFYRPLLGITLLVIAAGALFMIFRRRGPKSETPDTLTEMDLA